MMRACIKTNTEIEQFKNLQQRVEQLVIQKQKAEIDFGDIPDEFRGIFSTIFDLIMFEYYIP